MTSPACSKGRDILMITVFGSINMDLIATTARLPKPGETVAGNGFATAAGGKGANQALAARRAGRYVHMAGAVGKDGFAADALALLDDAGTDLSLVKHVDGPTGTALILVGGDGENMIAVVPGANGLVTAGDAETAVGRMNEGDILMLQLEVPVDAVERALSAGRAKGITSILNLAPLIPDAPRLGRLADIVIANETEFDLYADALGLAGGSREDRMHAFSAETGRTVVVTLGGDGVAAVEAGRLLRVPALPVTPVDTVGAGDTFCGYLAAGLSEGLPLQQALARAAAAGSLACTRNGAQPSIPLRGEVDAALKSA